MYQVFSGNERHIYARELDGIFQLRHRVFKNRPQWQVHSDKGMERDEFDDLNPIYFSASNEMGVVSGTWRLLPTLGPNMLRNVFPYLLGDLDMPNSPFVWEMSRLALDLGNENGGKNCSVETLFGAALEFCSAIGIRALVVVHDKRMARITQRTLGYPASWETQSHDMDGIPTTAAQYRIDSPTAFRKRRGLTEPILNMDQVMHIRDVA